ncbi:hypothetical protein [Ferviditalea candida]|uniref:Uncharacterized protein n=1 Tax=Ferviditalea candida TaxID=3108399 RepID=A0ABU5ZEK6_9BACL|nr:hypothetical protein [Paenibacillaceae bacterium T2]
MIDIHCHILPGLKASVVFDAVECLNAEIRVAGIPLKVLPGMFWFVKHLICESIKVNR